MKDILNKILFISTYISIMLAFIIVLPLTLMIMIYIKIVKKLSYKESFYICYSSFISTCDRELRSLK